MKWHKASTTREIRTTAQNLTRNWGRAYSVSWNTGALSQSIDRASVATLYSIGHTKLSNCTSTYDAWTQSVQTVNNFGENSRCWCLLKLKQSTIKSTANNWLLMCLNRRRYTPNYEQLLLPYTYWLVINYQVKNTLTFLNKMFILPVHHVESISNWCSIKWRYWEKYILICKFHPTDITIL